MGMSNHVVGYRSDKDPTYQKHKRVIIACEEAGIKQIPKETCEYFGLDNPEICEIEEHLEIQLPLQEWSDNDSSGFELIIKNIPEGVHKIRFYNSW